MRKLILRKNYNKTPFLTTSLQHRQQLQHHKVDLKIIKKMKMKQKDRPMTDKTFVVTLKHTQTHTQTIRVRESHFRSTSISSPSLSLSSQTSG